MDLSKGKIAFVQDRELASKYHSSCWICCITKFMVLVMHIFIVINRNKNCHLLLPALFFAILNNNFLGKKILLVCSVKNIILSTLEDLMFLSARALSYHFLPSKVLG